MAFIISIISILVITAVVAVINLIRLASKPAEKMFKLFRVTNEDGHLIEYRIKKLHLTIFGLHWSEYWTFPNGTKRNYGHATNLETAKKVLKDLIDKEKAEHGKEIYTDITPTERTETPFD